MSDTYFDSEEFRDILNRYETAQITGTPIYLESDELTDIAEYYHAKGDIGKAVEVSEFAISVFPGSPAPLLFRARIALLHDDDYAKATELAEQVSDKSDLDYFYIKAEILIVKNEIETANTYLHQCVAGMDEDDLADFYIDVATLFADYDQVEKAQEWLDLSDERDSPDYKELQGRIAMGRGQYEDCERIFNELIDSNPYSSPYWNQLASSQLLHNNFNDSITSSEFSIAINPNDDEAILNKANGLFALSNFEEALKFYKRFSELCPKEETGEILQGVTLLNMGRLEEAVTHLKMAEKLAIPRSPNLLEIYQELSLTLSKTGKIDEALGYVDRALLIPFCKEDELEVLRGHLVLEHGNIDDAQKYFQKAIRLSNSSPNIFLRIAISVFDNGYMQLAYKMFKALLQSVDNDWTSGWAYLAYCCKHMGKTAEYEEALRIACEKNPYETKMVLGDDFPSDLEAGQYYKFINQK